MWHTLDKEGQIILEVNKKIFYRRTRNDGKTEKERLHAGSQTYSGTVKIRITDIRIMQPFE